MGGWRGDAFLCQYSVYILTLNCMCILVLVDKFVVGGGVGWVECEFSVLLWFIPFHPGLRFGLGPSRTKNIIVYRRKNNP